MLTFIIALVMCLGAIAGLILVAPSVIYSWRIAPAYYNLARIALPFIALGYFGPQLFGINFPGRNTWVTALFLGGLALIVLAIVVIILNAVLNPLESRLLRWKPKSMELVE